MKKLLFILSVAMLSMWACSDVKMKSDGKYGEAVSADSALTVAEVMQLMQTQSTANVVVKGTINGVCKSEGCWLTLENKNGEEFFIDIKDKAFHLPFNVEGKQAVVKGTVTKSQISVADLQAAAREEGKTDAEINAITAPADEITMEATGLQLDMNP